MARFLDYVEAVRVTAGTSMNGGRNAVTKAVDP